MSGNRWYLDDELFKQAAQAHIRLAKNQRECPQCGSKAPHGFEIVYESGIRRLRGIIACRKNCGRITEYVALECDDSGWQVNTLPGSDDLIQEFDVPDEALGIRLAIINNWLGGQL